jgi:hypothetical protein
MIDKVYVVSYTRYTDEMLNGFATDEAGVKQILLNHYERDTGGDLIHPEIDMDSGLITVFDESEDDTDTFYILTIERATP